MIEKGVGRSVIVPPPDPRLAPVTPVYVSYMAPLPARSHDYTRFKSGMSSWLADKYDIQALSVVQGSGVDLSATKPNERGDRHGQVSILYGIPDTEIGQLFPDQDATHNLQIKRA
jgi:hypothetical protein